MASGSSLMVPSTTHNLRVLLCSFFPKSRSLPAAHEKPNRQAEKRGAQAPGVTRASGTPLCRLCAPAQVTVQGQTSHWPPTPFLLALPDYLASGPLSICQGQAHLGAFSFRIIHWFLSSWHFPQNIILSCLFYF